MKLYTTLGGKAMYINRSQFLAMLLIAELVFLLSTHSPNISNSTTKTDSSIEIEQILFMVGLL